MGVHLCAAWANAGYDVTMCSRSKEKAQLIVDELLSGRGYDKKVTGANSGQGDYCVPACADAEDAKDWKLRAGDNVEASRADLIVLGTMYEQAWPILETIAPEIRGRGKTILDMTNPFMARPDGYGAGLPEGGSPGRHPYPQGKTERSHSQVGWCVQARTVDINFTNGAKESKPT